VPVATIDADVVGTMLGRLAEAAPGPALVMTFAGDLVYANGRAQGLMASGAGWYQALRDGIDPDTGRLGTGKIIRIPAGRDPVDVEWTALAAGHRLCLILGRDVTFERQLRTALAESRQRYKDLVDISSDFAWETGPDGRFVFVSPGGALGFCADALIGRKPDDLAVMDETEADQAMMVPPFRANRRIDGVATWLVSAAGNPVCVSISALPLFDDTGRWIGARGVGKDITEQLNRSYELAQMRMGDALLNRIGQALRDRVEDVGTLHVAADEAAQILAADGCAICRLPPGSDALESAAEVGIRPFALERVLPEVASASEVTDIVPDGSRCSVMGQRTEHRGMVNGVFLVWRSDNQGGWNQEARRLVAGIAQRLGITLAKIAHNEHLRTLSERDALTGVYNRRGFAARLTSGLESAQTVPGALLYMDLDNFKAVNDTLGHGSGDAVLRELARLLTEQVRPGDIVSRLGGDEFVLWLAGAGPSEAERVAQRLLSGTGTMARWSASPELPLSLSIGIAVRDAGVDEPLETLIQRADQAMYAAKANGKGCYSMAIPTDGEMAISDANGGDG